MTERTYHQNVEDAILDGWQGPVMLPINGGEIHVHGRRCYVRNPRRITFLRFAIGRGRLKAEDLTQLLGMASASQVHQFLRQLQFALAIEKSHIKVQLMLEGRKGYWVAFDKRKGNWHD